jgi:hypothetical protein
MQGRRASFLENYVSFSLYGDSPRYIIPALKAAADVRVHLPGWKIIFFVDESVPLGIIKTLSLEAEIVKVNKSLSGENGMLWRFQALALENMERVIFRDADSRITAREARAVKEWVDSGCTLHIMRDHPYHNYKLLGGMFGLRSSEMTRAMSTTLRSSNMTYGEDIRVLETHVYATFSEDACVHASFHKFEPFAKEFPGPMTWSFVGEVDGHIANKIFLRCHRMMANYFPSLFGLSVIKKRLPKDEIR